MQDITISENELRYIYLKALKTEVIKEKVEEIEKQTNLINTGDYTKEVFSDEEKREIYKIPRMKKFIECLKSL